MTSCSDVENWSISSWVFRLINRRRYLVWFSIKIQCRDCRRRRDVVADVRRRLVEFSTICRRIDATLGVTWDMATTDMGCGGQSISRPAVAHVHRYRITSCSTVTHIISASAGVFPVNMAVVQDGPSHGSQLLNFLSSSQSTLTIKILQSKL